MWYVVGDVDRASYTEQHNMIILLETICPDMSHMFLYFWKKKTEITQQWDFKQQTTDCNEI